MPKKLSLSRISGRQRSAKDEGGLLPCINDSQKESAQEALLVYSNPPRRTEDDASEIWKDGMKICCICVYNCIRDLHRVQVL